LLFAIVAIVAIGQVNVFQIIVAILPLSLAIARRWLSLLFQAVGYRWSSLSPLSLSVTSSYRRLSLASLAIFRLSLAGPTAVNVANVGYHNVGPGYRRYRRHIAGYHISPLSPISPYQSGYRQRCRLSVIVGYRRYRYISPLKAGASRQHIAIAVILLRCYWRRRYRLLLQNCAVIAREQELLRAVILELLYCYEPESAADILVKTRTVLLEIIDC
jgi:hypothetical protein